MIAQALSTQANIEISISPQVATPATRVRDFMRMSHPEFHDSKMEDDPINFIDEAYRIVVVMGVSKQ